jgi:signal transduction histidine kinase
MSTRNAPSPRAPANLIPHAVSGTVEIAVCAALAILVLRDPGLPAKESLSVLSLLGLCVLAAWSIPASRAVSAPIQAFVGFLLYGYVLVVRPCGVWSEVASMALAIASFALLGLRPKNAPLAVIGALVLVLAQVFAWREGETPLQAEMSGILGLSAFGVYLLVLASSMLRERRYRFSFARLQAERDSSSMLAQLGLNMHIALHELEGRESLQANLATILRGELEAVREEGAPSWERIERIASLLASSYQESRTYSRGLRKRFLDPFAAEGWTGTAPCLASLLSSIADTYELALGLKIAVDCDRSILVPAAAQAPLVVILDNLIRNSREAGATSIGVSVERGAFGTRIELVNDGPPLEPCAACAEAEGCVGAPCARLLSRRSTKVEGTGLGLLAVEKAIARLDGVMRIRSGPERTFFSILFNS